jgi:hypothetical protein
MFWSKSHSHSLGPIHRNEAVNLSDDQTVAGEKTFSETTRIQAVLAGSRLHVLTKGPGSSQPAAADSGAHIDADGDITHPEQRCRLVVYSQGRGRHHQLQRADLQSGQRRPALPGRGEIVQRHPTIPPRGRH